jgi:putative hydrolase of the HAD superfamily
MIKHISFDAWNTLLIPNKKYAELRTELLADTLHRTPAASKAIYQETKHLLDSLAEQHGLGANVHHAFNVLISKFGAEDHTITHSLISKVSELFLANPPTILEESIDAINEVRAEGVTIGITSNTNFISGYDLAEVFERNFEFEVGVFSDLVGSSKPSKLIFDIHLKELAKRNAGVDRSEILHIGDNHICDFIGAKNFGFEAAFITNVDQVASILRNIK